MQTNCPESWFEREIGESEDLPNLEKPHTHIASGNEAEVSTRFACTTGIGYNFLYDHRWSCIFDGVTRA
jgi:hypothetical protein